MKTKAKTNLGLYAFWIYDNFPGVLGGPVERFFNDGRVEITGYLGYRFMPVLVVPHDAGVKIQERLKKLEEAYIAARNETHRMYFKKFAEEIPELAAQVPRKKE